MNTSKNNITWTKELAYAIGLITTDGCLSKDGRHIIFVSKDKELIKTFKKCLNLKNRISSKGSGFTKNKIKKYFYIQFGNKKMYDWLLGLGLKPNKTKTISELKIPNEFFFDFLRGHLDGDGYYRVYQDPIYPNSQRLYVRFTSASQNHINWLQNKIFSLLKINGYARTFGGITELSFAKNNSKLLLQKMYYENGLPSLSRKRKIIESFLG